MRSTCSAAQDRPRTALRRPRPKEPGPIQPGVTGSSPSCPPAFPRAATAPDGTDNDKGSHPRQEPWEPCCQYAIPGLKGNLWYPMDMKIHRAAAFAQDWGPQEHGQILEQERQAS